MKLDKICRTCLAEKSVLKPIFDACIPSMLMTCTSIQVMEGDGFPNQICSQCLQMVNRSYSFKQLCEKSDITLRQYINSIHLQIDAEQTLLNQVKNDNLFSATDDLHQSSFFSDIFNDASAQFVDNFEAQNADLAETMESLQTIAEQCLPPSWENDVPLVNVNSGSEETCDSFNFPQLNKCQFCGEMFKDDWTFSEHIKIHAGQAKCFCEICGKQCPSMAILMKHNEIHLIEKDLVANDKDKSLQKPNACNICGKVFLDTKTLKKHLKDFHVDPKDKRHVCTVCGKSYPQNKLLTLHMRFHTGDRPLSCETCGKTFALPSSLHKHKMLHTNLKKYECSICQKRFNQASNLNVHLRSHTGEKPFVCNICEKRCATQVNLEVHMRIHTGEKPYKCTLCGVAFTTGTQLKKHTLRHTGEKPYKCWHCGKAFRQKDTRDTHVRYHTGERPYACSFCPKKYIAASHLRVHLKSHSENGKYQCTMCEKQYVDSRSYKLHVLSHTGEHPYKCEICGKCFSKSSTFNGHIKSHVSVQI